MSKTDHPPRSAELFDTLELADASPAELAAFAEYHQIALDKLERCQRQLAGSGPIRGSFQLIALERASASDASAILLRLQRDDSTWLEVPRDFPGEQLAILLELLSDV